jgi:hypothetical protein
MSDRFRTAPMKDGIRYDSRGEPLSVPQPARTALWEHSCPECGCECKGAVEELERAAQQPPWLALETVARAIHAARDHTGPVESGPWNYGQGERCDWLAEAVMARLRDDL